MKLPQLSLRDLFWVVLVCACLCAWWVEHRARRRAENEAKEHVISRDAWQRRAVDISEYLSVIQTSYDAELRKRAGHED